jgi:3-oxoacyl-[acyl-carrier-protein] synthase II
MDSRRVVITGIGVVSPVGIGKDVFWNNLVNGVSGIKTISHFDTEGYATTIAGVVEGFNVDDYVDKKEARRMDRFQHFAMAAAQMAHEDSGLVINDSNASLSLIHI